MSTSFIYIFYHEKTITVAILAQVTCEVLSLRSLHHFLYLLFTSLCKMSLPSKKLDALKKASRIVAHETEEALNGIDEVVSDVRLVAKLQALKKQVEKVHTANREMQDLLKDLFDEVENPDIKEPAPPSLPQLKEVQGIIFVPRTRLCAQMFEWPPNICSIVLPPRTPFPECTSCPEENQGTMGLIINSEMKPRCRVCIKSYLKGILKVPEVMLPGHPPDERRLDENFNG